jgi:LacI family gluconate utilization system Gnt-I transcriptional repressor
MKAGSGWATMADVAQRANVSKITVSRVLRSPQKVKSSTRERVLTAIRDLGYVPDEAAGALSSGAGRMVAAIISTLEGSVFGTTIDGLSYYLREHGHELLLGSTGYSQLNEADLVATVFGHHPDGIVLTSSVHTPETVMRLKAMRSTVVEIWEIPEDPIDIAIGFSNMEAGIAITRFLYDLGRRKLAYIGGGPTADRRSRLRFEGFAQAYRTLGLGEPPIVPYDRNVPSAADRGAAGMRWILKNLPEVDAVFCTSDAVALGAICEARRQSKDVPGDIAVAGLGDFEFSGDSGLGLTTVKVPGFKIGETAGRLILERKQGEGTGARIVDLGFKIVRRSTA